MAWEKGLKSMQRVLKRGGNLFLSVPSGVEEKLIFNSCRIFRPRTIIDTLHDLCLKEMYLIHDFKIFKFNEDDIEKGNFENIVGEYDCGLFIFEK